MNRPSRILEPHAPSAGPDVPARAAAGRTRRRHETPMRATDLRNGVPLRTGSGGTERRTRFREPGLDPVRIRRRSLVVSPNNWQERSCGTPSRPAPALRALRCPAPKGSGERRRWGGTGSSIRGSLERGTISASGADRVARARRSVVPCTRLRERHGTTTGEPQKSPPCETVCPEAPLHVSSSAVPCVSAGGRG